MTYYEFYNKINLRNNIENRDLKTYLLALLKLVEQESEQPLTANLLSKLVLDAFTSEPKKFDQSQALFNKKHCLRFFRTNLSCSNSTVNKNS